MVRKLVENHKGFVSVEDLVPGNYSAGSRFVILLPRLNS